MSKLWVRTQELLQTTNIPMAKICVDTGLTLGWLMNVRYGRGKKPPSIPSVDKAERLYEYLSGKQLDV